MAYPNRDSTPFREFYNIPEAHTVIRGSLRYEGNPALVRALIDLGWLDVSEKPWLKDGITWAEIQQQASGAGSPAEPDLIKKVDERCTFSSAAERAEILAGLRWMGLFSDQLASTHGNLLDTLSVQLEKLCSLQPGERDLVMLQHKFVVRWKDGSEVSVCLPFPGARADLLNRRLSLLPSSFSEIRMDIPPCQSLLGSPVELPRRCFWTDLHPSSNPACWRHTQRRSVHPFEPRLKPRASSWWTSSTRRPIRKV